MRSKKERDIIELIAGSRHDYEYFISLVGVGALLDDEIHVINPGVAR